MGSDILWLEDCSRHASVIEWKECDVIRDLYDCIKTTAAGKTQELQMLSLLMACVYHYEKNADILQTFSGN